MKAFVMAAALVLSTGAQAQDAVRVKTPRGAEVEVIAEKPAGKGPFPAVILGSGSGYAMRQPILARLAQDLVANGVAVYRIDWAYRVAGTPFATSRAIKRPRSRICARSSTWPGAIRRSIRRGSRWRASHWAR